MAEDWINPREKNPLSLKRLLVPTPSDLLEMLPASPLANSVKNEGPALPLSTVARDSASGAHRWQTAERASQTSLDESRRAFIHGCFALFVQTYFVIAFINVL
jgi:hypothetical protein